MKIKVDDYFTAKNPPFADSPPSPVPVGSPPCTIKFGTTR